MDFLIVDEAEDSSAESHVYIINGQLEVRKAASDETSDLVIVAHVDCPSPDYEQVMRVEVVSSNVLSKSAE